MRRQPNLGQNKVIQYGPHKTGTSEKFPWFSQSESILVIMQRPSKPKIHDSRTTQCVNSLKSKIVCLWYISK